MLGQKGGGCDDSRNLLQPAQTDGFGFGSQPTALVIVEPGPFAQLFLEDSDLLLEVLNNVLLVAVDPTGETKQKKLKMVHPDMVEAPP